MREGLAALLAFLCAGYVTGRVQADTFPELTILTINSSYLCELLRIKVSGLIIHALAQLQLRFFNLDCWYTE